jgi:hypothetical protein
MEVNDFQNIDEHRAPLPGWGSYIVVEFDGQIRGSLVQDFVPKWEAYFPRNDPTDPRSAPSSPSRGIAAAREGDRIWLGGSWDNRAPGGLWSSYDSGATWFRDPDIGSASDIAFVPTSTGGELVLTQSAYEDQWSSVIIKSLPRPFVN